MKLTARGKFDTYTRLAPDGSATTRHDRATYDATTNVYVVLDVRMLEDVLPEFIQTGVRSSSATSFQ